MGLHPAIDLARQRLAAWGIGDGVADLGSELTALSGTLRMGAPDIKIPGIPFDIKPEP